MARFAAPEVAHQIDLALLAVRLLQHAVVHAERAACHLHERTRFLKQVPRAELFPVQEAVGCVVGERAPTDLRQAHAACALALGQQKGGVMLQRAKGRGRLGQNTHKQPLNLPAFYSPSSVTVRISC